MTSVYSFDDDSSDREGYSADEHEHEHEEDDNVDAGDDEGDEHSDEGSIEEGSAPPPRQRHQHLEKDSSTSKAVDTEAGPSSVHQMMLSSRQNTLLAPAVTPVSHKTHPHPLFWRSTREIDGYGSSFSCDLCQDVKRIKTVWMGARVSWWICREHCCTPPSIHGITPHRRSSPPFIQQFLEK
jgi:hypothetical protein